eukprot:TRINITY_DN30137_c0_g1_i1.p1 TRINITY_DN30137_c0_g1~~TRINITY_DN30137_c0_g1_i1.p1  ORF type:complete len:466 (+),score=64.81 TRINITY_DN30137_c0_g1_i1:315-1712(+)
MTMAPADSSALRVLSLLPSATDIIVAMGLRSVLVGRSHECDAGGVMALPTCTSAKYSMADGLSALEVHQAASTAGAPLWEATFGPLPRAALLVEWGLSPYRTDVQLIRELAPNVVLTQIQSCGGAATPDEVEAALREVLDSAEPITIVHMDPHNLADVWAEIMTIGRALRAPETGRECIARMKARMKGVSKMALGRPRKRVMCVQWIEPLFLGGAWIPELIRMAGGLPVQNINESASSGGATSLSDFANESGECDKATGNRFGVYGNEDVLRSIPTNVLDEEPTSIVGGVSLDRLSIGTTQRGSERGEGSEGREGSSHGGVSNSDISTRSQLGQSESDSVFALDSLGVWESARRLKADIILFAICGCALEESLKEARSTVASNLLGRRRGDEWSPKVAVMDANRLLSRSGPTLVESLEVLVEVLHPESQAFGHEGKAWTLLEPSRAEDGSNTDLLPFRERALATV